MTIAGSKTAKFLMIGFLIAVVVMPMMVSHVQAASLVACGLGKDNDNPCQICDLVKLFKNIIDFVTFRLTLILGTVLILISGFTIMIGGSNPEMIKTGRGMLTKTLIGVVIIYGSWFV